MSEQVISFRTAVLAKDRGFEQGDYPSYVISKETKLPYLTGIHPCHFGKGKTFYAATLSELQKWLREAHKYHVEIGRDEDLWEYSLYEFSQGNKHVPRGFPRFETYEQALEAGLQEALKLIKNGRKNS